LGQARARIVEIRLQQQPITPEKIRLMSSGNGTKATIEKLNMALSHHVGAYLVDHPWYGYSTNFNLVPDSTEYHSTLDMAMVAVSLRELDDLPYLYCGEVDVNGNFIPLAYPLEVGRAAAEAKLSVVVPAASAGLVAMAGAVTYPVSTTKDLLKLPTHELKRQPPEDWAAHIAKADEWDDLYYVKGQKEVKWALEVACAGGHNILMVGSPGEGKTLCAQRAYTILPPLDRRAALEVSSVWQGAGRIPPDRLVRYRPFVEASKQTTPVALFGGGDSSGGPTPGLLALANRGVLLADELFEWPRGTAEALRGPLNDRQVTIARRDFQVTWAAEFQLVATANPCPCGYYGSGVQACRCTEAQRRRYLAKISGPIFDRIDIRVEVPALGDAILGQPDGERSAVIAGRVADAVGRQEKRYATAGTRRNAELKPGMGDAFCCETKSALDEVLKQRDLLGLTSRGVSKLRGLARTVADLQGGEQVGTEHVERAARLVRWDPLH
jgi:magnesium chelatase family protein